jgi:hypothetical protein
VHIIYLLFKTKSTVGAYSTSNNGEVYFNVTINIILILIVSHHYYYYF